MKEGKTILSVLHEDDEAARIQNLPKASMRSLECLAASPILKIHHSFLEAAAVCSLTLIEHLRLFPLKLIICAVQ